MDKSMVTLTIVTITYNDLSGLKRTVQSVMEQRTSDIELLIIDGDSTDGTKEYLGTLIEKDDIQVISENDDGIYDAMNKGLRYASGRWVFYLNAGDTFLPGVVRPLIDRLKISGSYDAIYGDVILTTMYNGQIYYRPEKADRELSHLKKGMICSHQGIICKREQIIRLGGFDTSFRIAGDWDLISRMYCAGGRFDHIDSYIAAYDRDGISAKPHIMERHRVRKNNRFYRIVDLYLIKDLIHAGKSVLSSMILGNRKRALSIKLKRFQKP